MGILLTGGSVWTPYQGFVADCPVLVEEDRIVQVGGRIDPVAHTHIVATGKMILPGLVDLHTHGRIGHDFASATQTEMEEMKADYAAHGVTALFPTLASATLSDWRTAIQRVQNAGFDGIHLEGRYLNPMKRGAHAMRLLAQPKDEELEALLQLLQIPCRMTVAAELDEDGSFLALAKQRGICTGLGHTNATAEDTRVALSRGVAYFTHLFNAMPPMHHRDGGPVAVALTGNAYAELIVDGFHVCPDMVKLAYRCLGKDRLVLVTDSMEATGAPDGSYSIAGQAVVVKDRRAHTADGAIAGSTLELWQAVKNLMAFTGAPLWEAVTSATLTPARLAGLDHLFGSIAEGKRADLILVDGDMHLCGVIAAGRILDQVKE